MYILFASTTYSALLTRPPLGRNSRLYKEYNDYVLQKHYIHHTLYIDYCRPSNRLTSTPSPLQLGVVGRSLANPLLKTICSHRKHPPPTICKTRLPTTPVCSDYYDSATLRPLLHQLSFSISSSYISTRRPQAPRLIDADICRHFIYAPICSTTASCTSSTTTLTLAGYLLSPTYAPGGLTPDLRSVTYLTGTATFARVPVACTSVYDICKLY